MRTRNGPPRRSDGRNTEHGELGTDPPSRHATRAERWPLRRTARSLSPHPTPSPQSQEEEPRAGRFADRRTQPSAHEAKHDRPPKRDVHGTLQCKRSTCAHAIVLVFPWWTARISRRTWRWTCHRRHRWRRLGHRWRRLGHRWRRLGRVTVGRVTGDTDGAVLGTRGAVMGVSPLGVSPADPPARWRGRRSCLRGWRQCERPGHHRPVCDLEG